MNFYNTTGWKIIRWIGIVDIKNDSLQYKEDIIAAMDISDSGTVTGSININSMDYARNAKLEIFKRNKESFKKEYFPDDGLLLNITKIDVKNLENDSLPLEINFDFNSTINSTGNYRYISLNFFPDFKKNPFLSDTRFSNVNFGYKRNLDLNASFKLPGSFIIDELPKTIKMITPDNDIIFQRQVSYDKESNTVTALIHLEFKNSLYTVDEFPILKEVYKRLFDYLKEPVLLKKK